MLVLPMGWDRDNANLALVTKHVGGENYLLALAVPAWVWVGTAAVGAMARGQ